ncbi:MAG: Holliday junction resolvase RuvX [Ignavibacteria bacterium]|nr:MAG: Holliday junction resolvase RuvX [Ignavibacteria bacterium]
MEKRILAIDYGARRVGIAVSDPMNIFAIPLETLDNDQKLFKNILSIIEEKNIGRIIIGYPLKESGERSGSTELVEKFREELERKTDLPIEYIDERYSSEIAKDHIIQSIPSKKKRRNKKNVDMRAAAVFLTDYLNSVKK